MKKILTLLCMCLFFAGAGLAQDTVYIDTLNTGLDTFPQNDHMTILFYGDDITMVMTISCPGGIVEDHLYSSTDGSVTDMMIIVGTSMPALAEASYIFGTDQNGLTWADASMRTTDNDVYILRYRQIPAIDIFDTIDVVVGVTEFEVNNSSPKRYRLSGTTADGHYHAYLGLAADSLIGHFDWDDLDLTYTSIVDLSDAPTIELASGEVVATFANTTYHVNAWLNGRDGHCYHTVFEYDTVFVATDTVELVANNLKYEFEQNNKKFISAGDDNYSCSFYYEASQPIGRITNENFATNYKKIMDKLTGIDYTARDVDLYIDSNYVFGGYRVDGYVVCYNRVAYHLHLTSRQDFSLQSDADEDLSMTFVRDIDPITLDQELNQTSASVTMRSDDAVVKLCFPTIQGSYGSYESLVPDGSYSFTDTRDVYDSDNFFLAYPSLGIRDLDTCPSYVAANGKIWFITQGTVDVWNAPYGLTFNIVASNSKGQTVNVQLSNYDGIEEAQTSFAVYPNPVTDVLHIDCSNLLSASLYSADGRMVMATKDNKLDMGSLPDGIYMLKTVSPQGTQIQKVVKR